MTGIDFHFNAPDKLGHACRLLRKAVAGSGAQLVVVGEPALLEAIDSALWSVSGVDFIAHCRAGARPEVLARSPVVLAADCSAAGLPHAQVLVNVGPAVPQGFERFARLIDIVANDEDDRLQGRARWRHYAERGYAITRHDIRPRAA